MDKQIHPNYIKSSNLFHTTAGLGLINSFFASELLNTGQNNATAILTLLIISGIGFLIPQGKNWVKYLLLVFILLGLTGVPFMINNIIQRPIVGAINILQLIMQVWAMVLLFKIPKEAESQNE